MYFISAFLILFLLVSCTQEPAQQIEIRGVYGHPNPLWDKGYSLPELGINAVFVHGGSVDSALMEQAKIKA